MKINCLLGGTHWKLKVNNSRNLKKFAQIKGKMLNFYRKLRDFLKKFVKLTWFCIVLTENFVKSLWRVVIYSHRNFFSSNHLFSYFFSKIVDFTKLLPKKRKSKFSKLPHFDGHRATGRKTKNLVSPKIFRQINSLVTSLLKILLSWKFCQKYVRKDCSK